MKAREIWLQLLCVLALVSGCDADTDGKQADINKPLADDSEKGLNVLFIAVDDLRPQGSIYGFNNAVTPGMDALAQQGVTFTNAYANVPVCGASRASLMTGLRPSSSRFLYSYSRADEDAPHVPTAADFFKEHGYHTASIGKIFHRPEDSKDAWTSGLWSPQADKVVMSATSPRNYLSAENIAIDRDQNTRRPEPWENLDVPDDAYFDGMIRKKAIEKLDELVEEDEPFFLAVGFMKPHLPFNAPKKYWDLYPEEKISLPANATFPETVPLDAWHEYPELKNYSGIPEKVSSEAVSESTAKKLIQGYYASMSYSDSQLHLLLNRVKDLGIMDNTIIVLWGDHGWSLGEHALWSKHSAFDIANKTTLVISSPGMPNGRQSSAIVELVDLYPTLAELTELDAPDHLEGTSLVDVLQTPESIKDDYAFTRWSGYSGQQHSDSLRTKQYTFTQWRDASGKVISRMLFDIQADPGETLNLADDINYKDIVHSYGEILAKKISASNLK